MNVNKPFKHWILVILFVSVKDHLSDLPSFPHYAYSIESMIGCKYLYPAEPSEAVESYKHSEDEEYTLITNFVQPELWVNKLCVDR